MTDKMTDKEKAPAAGNSGGPETKSTLTSDATPATRAGQGATAIVQAIVPFGKHKGKDVLEVMEFNPQYLTWLTVPGEVRPAEDASELPCACRGRSYNKSRRRKRRKGSLRKAQTASRCCGKSHSNGIAHAAF